MATSVLRVAVLSVPFGGGHRSVADGIAYALAQCGQDGLNADVEDALGLVSDRLPLTRWGARLYAALTRPGLRSVYAALFWAVDRWPVAFGRACTALFGRSARAWLRSSEPDIVVSTFPFVSFVVGEAIHRRGGAGRPPRLITVVTDGGHVNRSWFSGRVDAFVVTDADTKRFAQGLQIRRPVVHVETPLRPGFYRSPGRMAARARLGLDSRPAVLIWGGGQGLARGVESLVDLLVSPHSTVTSIVVTGSNDRLASRLRKRVESDNLRVFGECPDVPSLLSAVDLVVGKAGWVSLNEARVAGLSTVCIDALPGQERENLRISGEQGFAAWVSDPRQAAEIVRSARTRDADLSHWRASTSDRHALCDLILGQAHGSVLRSVESVE